MSERRGSEPEPAPGQPTIGALSDEQIVLGPLEAGDSEQMYEWINDRELVVLSAPFRPVGWEDHRQWFEECQRRRDAVIFAIRLREAGQLLGTVQLHSIHPVHRRAELQIRIGRAEHRGRGYGSTAVRLALRFAFDDLNLHRVSLEVFAGNGRAIRAYEKAGFTCEGVQRGAAFIAGAYQDVAVMGILREEYLSSRSTDR